MGPLDQSPECEWAQRELFEARPGRPVSDRLQSHLAGCPRCRNAQEFDSRFAGVLRAAPGPATPINLESRVRRLRRRRKILQGAVAVAAAVLIGIATLAIWSP